MVRLRSVVALAGAFLIMACQTAGSIGSAAATPVPVMAHASMPTDAPAASISALQDDESKKKRRRMIFILLGVAAAVVAVILLTGGDDGYGGGGGGIGTV